MAQTTADAKAILSFRDVETKLNLRRSFDTQFFYEWQAELPTLTAAETVALERLSTRYLHYLKAGEVTFVKLALE